MTTRRGFLAGVIAAGMAPAIVKSGILMPVKQIIVPKTGIAALLIPPGTMPIDDTANNPLHFGNMLWTPEVVLFVPVAQRAKELPVTPRFRHVTSLPVMAVPSFPATPFVPQKNEDFDLLNFIRKKVFA